VDWVSSHCSQFLAIFPPPARGDSALLAATDMTCRSFGFVYHSNNIQKSGEVPEVRINYDILPYTMQFAFRSDSSLPLSLPPSLPPFLLPFLRQASLLVFLATCFSLRPDMCFVQARHAL
jgi:hypothetical protein